MDIKIKVGTDDSSIKTLIDELTQLGAVDKKNAQQFAQNNLSNKEYHAKLQADLKAEQAEILKLGAAYKQAGADHAALNKELNNHVGNINKIQSQINSAKGAVGGFGTSVKQAFSSFGEGIKGALLFGGIAGAAALAAEGVISFGKEAIKAFEDAQKAANDLKFTVTSIGGESAAKFEELLTVTEDLSNNLNNLYTPEQLQGVSRGLSLVKLSADQIKDLLPRIADVAARSGKSIEEVGQAFSKALGEGQTKGLVDLGLKFKSTGDRVQDFNLLMKKSENFIGGAADAMDDLGNKSVEAANKMNMAQEQLGAELAPIWEDIKLGILEATLALTSFFTAGHRATGGRGPAGLDISEYFASEKLRERVDEQKKLLIKAGESEDQAAKHSLQILLKQAQDEEKIASDKLDALRRSTEDEQSFKAQVLVREYAAKKAALEEIEKLTDPAKKKDLESKGVDSITKSISTMSEEQLKLAEKQIADAQSGILESTDQFTTDLNGLNTNALALVQAHIDKRRQIIEAAAKKEEELLKKLREDRDKDEDAYDRSRTAAIKQEGQRHLAEEEDNYDREKKRLTDQQAEAEKIIKNGSPKAKAAAQALLESNLRYQEQLEKDHNQRMQNILEEGIDKRNKARADEAKKALDEYEKALKEAEEAEINVVEGREKKAIIKGKDRDKAEIDALKEKLRIARYFHDEYSKEVIDAEYELFEKQKALEKQRLDLFTETSQKITDAVIEHSQEVQKANNFRISQQDSMIETQRVLASKGLANELAFEEKRRNELEKAQIKEQERQRKAKEFQVFLNALVKYSEDNPSTALGKALALLATTKVAEAVFMEEGGIVGQTSKKRMVGGSMNNGLLTGRRHSQGGILTELESGEGVLNRKEMAALGHAGFNRLKGSLAAGQSSSAVTVVDMQPVVDRIASLEKTVANKKELSIEWDGLDTRIERTVANGIKETVRIMKSKKGI